MDPQMDTNDSEGNEAGGFELCIVCGDKAHGRYYGAMTCEDCKEFFKRSINMRLAYECRGSMSCEVTKQQLQNCCQYCRLQKCLACGMIGDSVPYNWKPIMDKLKGEAREPQVVADSPLLHTQINRKEEPSDSFNAVPPAGPAPNLQLEVTVAMMTKENFHVGNCHGGVCLTMAPYLGAATSCRQQIRLNTELAENMSKFGAINENLQSACTAPQRLLGSLVQQSHIASPLRKPLAAPLEDDNNHDVVITPESVPLPPRVPARTDSSPATRLYVAWEGGSHLLYALARWLLTLPAATALPTAVQEMLFRNRWSGLFVLGLAQWEAEMDMDTLLPILAGNLEEELRDRAEFRERGERTASPPPFAPHSIEVTVEDYTDEQLVEITTVMYRLRMFIRMMQKLQVTDQEYAHLRALCLFSADGVPELLSHQLQELQLKVARSLRKICKAKNDRVETLLLQLPTLRNFSGNFIEDMFFAEYFGELSVDDAIPHLLNAQRLLIRPHSLF